MDLPLLQNNNIFTSWHFPNLKTFIQEEQTIVAEWSKLKQYVQKLCKLYNKSF